MMCEGLTGKLAQLSSVAECEHVGNFSKAIGRNDLLVFNGMKLAGGVWRWHVTGEALNLTNQWDTNEPSNYGVCGGHCLNQGCSPARLHDIACVRITGYVCECSTLV